MAASGPVGCVFGAATASIILAKTSPKWVLIICDIIGIVGTLIMMIPNFPCFVIARLINGFSIGVNSADIPVVNRQVSPEKILGQVGVIFSIFINVGIFVSGLWGYGMDINNPKGDMFFEVPIAFPLIVLVARLIALLTCYRRQTPLYYLLKDQEENCREYLAWVYEDKYVDLMLALAKKDCEVVLESSRRKENLCGNRFRNRLILGCFLQILQQLSGINAVIFYSSIIFSDAAAGNSTTLAVLVNISGLLTIVTCFMSGAFTKFCGRKTILWAGDLICVLMLIVLGFLSLDSVKETNPPVINWSVVILIYAY